jgi:hypothetical protein
MSGRRRRFAIHVQAVITRHKQLPHRKPLCKRPFRAEATMFLMFIYLLLRPRTNRPVR